MAIEITGAQFNPKTVRRFVQKQFEKQGLVFSDQEPDISKKLKREEGSSLAHVIMHLKSGMKLKLGIKFDIQRGKILPKSKGLIYNAKLNTATIPLAKPKGEDYDWSAWIKKIAEFVKRKEEKYKPKPPTISKGKATDNKIPNTFKAKLAVKKEALAVKKAELAKQQKIIDAQTAENTKLETEIEAFKQNKGVSATESVDKDQEIEDGFIDEVIDAVLNETDSEDVALEGKPRKPMSAAHRSKISRALTKKSKQQTGERKRSQKERDREKDKKDKRR